MGLKKKHFFVQVMGVTGAGKTTFAKFLNTKLRGHLLEELSVDENPFFVSYYRNPAKYSFSTQLFFLFTKWQQTKKCKRYKLTVQEPPIYEDALYAQARLTKNSWSFRSYNNFYQGLISAKNFPKPDVVIYLHIKFKTMLKRIKDRAKKDKLRKVELKESKNYWQRLWELHESWVKENPLGLKIVTLDMDKFAFSNYKTKAKALETACEELVGKTGSLIG